MKVISEAQSNTQVRPEVNIDICIVSLVSEHRGPMVQIWEATLSNLNPETCYSDCRF
jgi:hypothetical protein